jgi:hypothetical protein
MKTSLHILFCLVAGSALMSCRTTCDIKPPPSVAGTDKEMSAKVAANAISTAISGGEVSGSYKNVVNNTYQTVNQDDIAFYLLMQAYNCESGRGHTAAAAEILALARQELARRHNAAPAPTALAVTSTALTSTEAKVLKNSPPTLKEEVKKTIAKPKAAPAPKKKKTPAPSASASPSA